MTEARVFYKTKPQPIEEFYADSASLAHPFALGANGNEEQAKGTILTRWVRSCGVDIVKLRDSEIDFVLIQIGIGLDKNELLDEQIDNCEEAGKDFGFFHLPSAYAGSAKGQAQFAYNAIASRGFGDRLLEADFEHAVSGDPNSLITADQGWIYYQEIEHQAGRNQIAYSNPNVLRNIWYEPNWMYDVKWIIARYMKAYEYFDEFFADYPWKHIYGYLPDEFYNQCVLGYQFTKYLDAQHYFAVEKLPGGGSGIKSGTGEAMLMTAAEMALFINGESTPPPDPELEERVTVLEGQMNAVQSELSDIWSEIARIWEKIDTEPDPEPDDFIVVAITEKHKAHWYKDTDESCPDPDKGKPKMLTRDDLPPLLPSGEEGGKLWKCQAKLYLSCHDNADTPTCFSSGMAKFFRIIEDGDYHGRFIRADKASKVENA